MIGLNIEMPSTCDECLLEYDGFSCRVTDIYLYDDGFNPSEQRHPDCPLVEITDRADHA